MSDGEAAIRMCLSAPHVCGAEYRRALARRLGLDDREAAAVLNVAAAGRLTAGELGLALVLPAAEAEALVERLVADGRLVRTSGPAGEQLGLARSVEERLARLMQPLVEDLDAVAARLSPNERAIVGRFLEQAAAVSERHARAVARRAIDEHHTRSSPT